MKIAEVVAGKTVGVIATFAVIAGVIYYFKSGITETINNVTQAVVNTTNKATTGVKNELSTSKTANDLGQLETIFSGMRASGGNTASTGGAIQTGGYDFNWVDALSSIGNPTLAAKTWGGAIVNYFTPTQETGNPQSVGIPLLLARPTVYPKESQEIVDKTLADSWFTYTGKN